MFIPLPPGQQGAAEESGQCWYAFATSPPYNPVAPSWRYWQQVGERCQRRGGAVGQLQRVARLQLPELASDMACRPRREGRAADLFVGSVAAGTPASRQSVAEGSGCQS